MVPIEEIFKEIMGERERQDHQWGGPPHDDRHSPCDWAAYIDKQLSAAENEWLEKRNLGLFSERMRKIAALAVAAIQSIDRKSDRQGG